MRGVGGRYFIFLVFTTKNQRLLKPIKRAEKTGPTSKSSSICLVSFIAFSIVRFAHFWSTHFFTIFLSFLYLFLKINLFEEKTTARERVRQWC